jgi:hypothetical protein
MQFIATYGSQPVTPQMEKSLGVYFGTHDPTGNDKSFNFLITEENGESIEISTQDSDRG